MLFDPMLGLPLNPDGEFWLQTLAILFLGLPIGAGLLYFGIRLFLEGVRIALSRGNFMHAFAGMFLGALIIRVMGPLLWFACASLFDRTGQMLV